MGIQQASSPVASAQTTQAPATEHDRQQRADIVRARHQRFGFALLGGMCCLAALVLSRWQVDQDPGRWFWVVIGPLTGAYCLVRAQGRFGDFGADRDASPYYGIYAGAASGAILLVGLTVDGWILPGVFFVIALLLAFMAWIEQSAIGMTAALSIAVLCIGSGVAALSDGSSVALASLSVGIMLLAAALALGEIEPGPGVEAA